MRIQVYALLCTVVYFSLTSIFGQAKIFSPPLRSESLVSEKEMRDAKRRFNETKIKVFFTKYGSELADEGRSFVEVAEKYNLDWRLLPAIAMVESTGCKRYIQGTHNCWGWNKGVTRFSSFSEAMDHIAKSLTSLGYYRRWQGNKEDLSLLATVYCPPTANSWEKQVRYFRNQL